MAIKRPRDTDSAETMNRLRVFVWLGPAVFIMLSLAEWKVVGMGPLLLLLMLANLGVIAIVGILILRGVDVGARAWVAMVTGAGNIQPAPSYSAQDSLIIRGRYAEAEQSFQALLSQNPGDHDARLALALLYRTHLDNPSAAERLYLEVRRGKPSPKQEATAHNHLIDLYRSTGQRGRLMAELARFAERYGATRPGVEARRALDELKRQGSEES